MSTCLSPQKDWQAADVHTDPYTIWWWSDQCLRVCIRVQLWTQGKTTKSHARTYTYTHTHSILLTVYCKVSSCPKCLSIISSYPPQHSGAMNQPWGCLLETPHLVSKAPEKLLRGKLCTVGFAVLWDFWVDPHPLTSIPQPPAQVSYWKSAHRDYWKFVLCSVPDYLPGR